MIYSFLTKQPFLDFPDGAALMQRTVHSLARDLDSYDMGMVNIGISRYMITSKTGQTAILARDNETWVLSSECPLLTLTLRHLARMEPRP
jgi:hypothetical protein